MEGLKCDVIGDVHGCYDELKQLMHLLGYRDDGIHMEEDRRLVFTGDLVAKGPQSAKVVAFVMGLLEQARAVWVRGNHDHALIEALSGSLKYLDDVHLLQSLREIKKAGLTEGLLFHAQEGNIPFFWRHGGLLVVHGGVALPFKAEVPLSEEEQRLFLYGEEGWQHRYSGRELVIYGHHVVEDPYRVGRTLGIDTGVVYGGALTAYRFPEDTLVSIQAKKSYLFHQRRKRPVCRRYQAI